MVPMKEASGIRTPGSCSDTACFPSIDHLTRKGSVNTIGEEAEVGQYAGEPKGPGHDIDDVDLKDVAGLGALDVDGPGHGMDDSAVDVGDVL